MSRSPHRELRRAPSPLDDPTSPLSRAARQPLMLGLFLPLQTGAFSQSTLERGTRWEFDYNQRLTLRAEAAGFDFVFGLQQWVGKGGFGGEQRYRENFLDPFLSTVALSATTSTILSISTVHVLYGNWHPLHLARFAATADHIAGGRYGLNIVTGYAAGEPPMFGMERIDHDRRYDMADEFTSVMEDLWAGEENLTHDGEFYALRDAYVSPRPRHGRPILVAASGSPAGYAFAGRHADIVFTSSPAGAAFEGAIDALPAHVERIKRAARERGREVKVIIFPLVICRETDAEAEAYRDRIVAHADHESLVNYHARHASGDSAAWPRHVLADRALGGHLQIVGGPEKVARDLDRLHAAGFDGVQLGFFDYEPELAYFTEAVLPLLEARGLRR
ncbi:FMNH2-dependent dimethyl sulfone monooxygenase [Streptomyces zhaozhouensis]|uniref:FMNH2-dependent dimethyl sulfone monooxygenase n=1 Tax=Streptomyces zhaozhouensis TaxID=1300267 RepID=A0A286DU90_9ACTN|nr:LLM class flavin-dependent oxidoreductase [Streptomyces zhaozhouensis]SOD62134.1 FMNH2-dependent dimethyl sulfone monooxygenase [Streptomyces zhaozhouensis]